MFMSKHNKGQAEVGNKRKIKRHKVSLFYCFGERHENVLSTKELTDLLYENEFCFYIFSTTVIDSEMKSGLASIKNHLYL